MEKTKEELIHLIKTRYLLHQKDAQTWRDSRQQVRPEEMRIRQLAYQEHIGAAKELKEFLMLAFGMEIADVIHEPKAAKPA